MKKTDDNIRTIPTQEEIDKLPVPSVVARFHETGVIDVFTLTAEGWKSSSGAPGAPSAALVSAFGTPQPPLVLLTPLRGVSIAQLRWSGAVEAAAQLGWEPFGSHVDRKPDNLAFAGIGQDGLPVWERDAELPDVADVVQIGTAILAGMAEKILRSLPDGVEPEQASMSASAFLTLIENEVQSLGSVDS